jgi:hypothetical protein
MCKVLEQICQNFLNNFDDAKHSREVLCRAGCTVCHSMEQCIIFGRIHPQLVTPRCSMQRGALTTTDVVDALGLQQEKSRKWHVQASIATRYGSSHPLDRVLRVVLSRLSNPQADTS